MARITTSSSAAAMSTAAVGESPKMVVRSTTVERGRAEAPSSRRSSVFTELELLERSVVTLPEALPPGVATGFVDRNVAQGRGASPAFHYEDRTLTYADVQDLANRTGNALLELGVQMEDRVLVLCLDTPEFLGAFWGAIKIGAIPIPVNTLMRSEDYLYFLQDSRAKAAVISAPLLAEAGP